MATLETEPQPTLIELRERFFTALLSDVLDDLGYMNQAMHHTIRPLDSSLVMVGRARTALCMDVYERPAPGENPYELEIKLVDDLKADEIPVFACGTSGRMAPWGGLLSTAAKFRGSAGAVMDGLVRDTREILAAGFPVFHGGIAPLDCKGRGKVAALDVGIECSGVKVNSGDLVFGDADGVIVVPQEIEARVLEVAQERLRGERNTLADLEAGERLATVFAKYGIL
ncbi:RraA family protein [Nitratireductor indicus]|uniref:Dimethylmenaquinone methyltransferase n=1 Tax=Nitratireductor indicus C115 TaxID=1231190 RepID=K2NS49_9HYPH|nr:RraA family protein [Nitratireductor indicus]EKF42135.1 dimethylmenaquinone methyltransferase [Nitratireductor indicus C115]MDS1136214.1 RraA family protein [Nitratireductor indicus]SFQ61846.1 Regulator of RNase E activity RraA [Nitratireductor indicus]